jgi:hypothetical protein
MRLCRALLIRLRNCALPKLYSPSPGDQTLL